MKRNHVIVTVLVFMIAIAGYLSLTDKQAVLSTPQMTADGEAPIQVAEQDLALHNDFFQGFSELETEAPDAFDKKTGEQLSEDEVAALDAAMKEETGEVVETSAQTMEPTQQVVITKKQGQLASNNEVANKEVNVSFFAEEKMLREQARAKQIETLTNYVADSNMDKDQKAKAAENLLMIQQRIEKENGAESLLRAKGFNDVFVRMDDDTVDVVVNDDELTDEEIAQIEEIVQRKTGYTVGQIKISRLTVNNQTAQN